MDRTCLASPERRTPRDHANRTASQWIALRENLKEADTLIVSRFCLCLQIMALSLYSDYRAKEARDILARGEISMLQTFFEKDDGLEPESSDQTQADHIIALAHGLFEASGGQQSTVWDQFNDQYSPFENQVICGLMVDVTGNYSIKEAHTEQLYHAILQSKLLEGNKPLSFAMFLEIIQKCEDVINPGLLHRRSVRESNYVADMI